MLQLHEHAAGDEVGVLDYLVDLVDGRHRDVRRHEVVDRLVPSHLRDPLLHQLLIGVFDAEELPELVHMPRPESGEPDPAAVLRPHQAAGSPPPHGILLPQLVKLHPREGVTRYRGVVGDHAVELGHVDHLPLASPVPMPDRCDNRHRRHRGRTEVAVGLRHLQRRPLWVCSVAGQPCVAAHRLSDHGVGASRRVGAGLAEA